MKKNAGYFARLLLPVWITLFTAMPWGLLHSGGKNGISYFAASEREGSSAATTPYGELYVWAPYGGSFYGQSAVLYAFSSVVGKIAFQPHTLVAFSDTARQACRLAASSGGRVYAGWKSGDSFHIAAYSLRNPRIEIDALSYSGDQVKVLSQCAISTSTGERMAMWGSSLRYLNGQFAPVNQQPSAFPDAPQFTRAGGYGWTEQGTGSPGQLRYCLNEPALSGESCIPLPANNLTHLYLPRVMTWSATSDHFFSGQWLAGQNRVASFGFNNTLAEPEITDWKVWSFQGAIEPSETVLTANTEEGSISRVNPVRASTMFLTRGDKAYWNLIQSADPGQDRLRRLKIPDHLILPPELRSAVVVTDDTGCQLPPANQTIHQFYTTVDGQVFHVYQDSSGEPAMGKSIPVKYLQGLPISKAYTLVNNQQLVIQAAGPSGNRTEWRVTTVDLDQFGLSRSYPASRSSLGGNDLSYGLEFLLDPEDINLNADTPDRWALVIEDDQQRLVSLINDKPSNRPNKCGLLIGQQYLDNDQAFGVSIPRYSGSFGATTEELRPCLEKYFTKGPRTIYPMRFRQGWQFINQHTQLGAIASCSHQGCNYYWQPKDCQAIRYNFSAPKVAVTNARGEIEPGFPYLLMNIAFFDGGPNPTLPTTASPATTESPTDDYPARQEIKVSILSAGAILAFGIVFIAIMLTVKCHEYLDSRAGYTPLD